MVCDSLLTSRPQQCSFLTSQKQMYFFIEFFFPYSYLVTRSASVWCPQLFCIHAFRRTAIRNLINMFVCHTGQKFQNVVSLDWKYWWFVQFAWTQTLALNMYCFRVTVAVIDSSMQVPKPFQKTSTLRCIATECFTTCKQIHYTEPPKHVSQMLQIDGCF
jgi:hypothetical protein